MQDISDTLTRSLPMTGMYVKKELCDLHRRALGGCFVGHLYLQRVPALARLGVAAAWQLHVVELSCIEVRVV